MKFVLKPSLEHMARVKIVVSLWNQNDVRSLISKLNSSNFYLSLKWKTIEERVIKKALQLLLQQLLKEKVLGFIKPIGLEIRRWVQFNRSHIHLPVHLPTEFCWTPQGRIDRKKTAELLVKDDNFNISTRYKLACVYCLEDDIHELWYSMPEDLKETDLDEFPINFWSDVMKFGYAHFSYGFKFLYSAFLGNKEAAVYFLQKLTPREKEQYLARTAKHVIDADILCFLISEMNEEQQMKFFRQEPYKVLQCFLQWPLQSFFIEIASCMWDFLSRNDYDSILKTIINKVRDGYKDWNYKKLLNEFWQKSPSALKSSITNEIDKSRLLLSLFDIKDKENIILILKDTTLSVKQKLVYSDIYNIFWEHSIHSNEWDFLEFFTRECLP